jgi:hypothetical protein
MVERIVRPLFQLSENHLEAVLRVFYFLFTRRQINNPLNHAVGRMPVPEQVQRMAT